MAINAVRNRRSGPGGGARRLHQSQPRSGLAYGGDLGSTRVVKVQFLPGMVPPIPDQHDKCQRQRCTPGGCLNSSLLAARGGAGQQKPPHFTSGRRSSMRRSRIDYGRLVESALRTVVRDVLSGLAKEGAPSPHHFYVTFRTHHPGVAIPEFLRDRYPTDMTIVLQHQFWDLAVDEEGFGGHLELQRPDAAPAHPVHRDQGVRRSRGRVRPAVHARGGRPAADGRGQAPGRRPATQAADDGAEDSPVPPGGAEIVTLDRFRKK